MARMDSKAEAQAGLVMGTNNSSIVSKRSVERLYYPEPHYFRYFVKKPQRRSPLINRGYWLRMYAVERSVQRFLEQPSEKPKLVLNLGCGYDPLPFQFLSRHPELCKNARFFDIDYHKLMVNKRNMIQQCRELNCLFPDLELPPESDTVLLRSKQYVGIGCDLGELQKLEEALKAEIASADVSILYTAEVSLTYMDVNATDALIQWASSLSNDVQFSLLEQYFPDGPDHPFASTMMKHFNKLNTPLRSIHKYPALSDQEQRFLDRGWTHAEAKSLWSLWSDSGFISPEERASLDQFEEFDEWEELALFASHYYLLTATTGSASVGSISHDGEKAPDCGGCDDITTNDLELISNCPSNFTGHRRFGAAVQGWGRLGLHGGVGRQTRLASTSLFGEPSAQTSSLPLLDFPPLDCEARMCHSVTDLDGFDCLLAGGRASPKRAFSDCWLRCNGEWAKTRSLPSSRYRHSATKVRLSDGNEQAQVLVYGGKSETGDVLAEWLLWDISAGWQPVHCIQGQLIPRFGHSLVALDDSSGVMFGGMTQDGLVLDDFWSWKLEASTDRKGVTIDLKDLTGAFRSSAPLYEWLGRFGASATLTSEGLFVIGGVCQHGCIPERYEILVLPIDGVRRLINEEGEDPREESFLRVARLHFDHKEPRPLLIGHASREVNSQGVLILGGGAVCFSFGTFWNEGTWFLRGWPFNWTNNWLHFKPPVTPQINGVFRKPEPKSESTVTTIRRVNVKRAEEFRNIVQEAAPVILSDLDVGPCVKTWTKEYLKEAVGSDRKVVVHDSQAKHMNFQTKNFAYVTKEFGTFIDEVYNGSRQYLRAISSEQPTQLPANLYQDFPELSNDFRLPEELSSVLENAHSSPLRISGPVVLWLHYDVMANVLCQIQGEKRLILYPPADISHLNIPAGSSSSSINVFSDTPDAPLNSPPNTHPHEALLKPGDILFIPPLWLHTASPTEGVSVAVNIFFRNLTQGYVPGRDVYGNRDLEAYEKGRRDVAKIVKSFACIPKDMAKFYIDRLADELKEIVDT